MKKLFLLLIIIFSFAYCKPEGFDPITSEELSEHATFLASDKLVGRKIGEPGIIAEEEGLLGSEYFTNLYSDIDIKYMINLDMIGRNSKEHFVIYNSKNNIDNIINIINDSKPVQDLSYNVKRSGTDIYSDDYNFRENGIPTISFFTGYHDDYHGAGDGADKLDYHHMQLITEFAFNIVYALAISE